MSLRYLSLLAISLAFILYVIRRKRSTALSVPPGPPTSWLGSVDLPKTDPWRTYTRWRQTYGDLVYINVFGNPILILNSSQAISDLLEKRSANYSSRPTRTMVIDLMGWDWLVSSMPYGSGWKQHRNLFQKHFPTSGSAEHHPLQVAQTHAFLRDLLQQPEEFAHHIRKAAAAIIVKITYGIDISEQIDAHGGNYVSLADAAISLLANAGIFGTYIVDYLPLLKYTPSWLPGASFKRKAKGWRKVSSYFVNRPFDVVKERMRDGTAEPSIVAKELENIALGYTTVDESVIKNTAATTYAAGSDTVVGSLHSLFLAMVLNPHVQKKAQRELDTVVGKRLPDFSDRHQLPYIDCICHELLRWNPVTPLGLAHYIAEDDVYRNYRLPRGTTVIPNVWGVLHDPLVYPEPFAFNPDRFAQSISGDASSSLNIIPDAAFGFGRRMCPGRWFAFDFLWLAVASVLSTYDITHALDDNGERIVPKEAYRSALLSHPVPFQCRITPRTADTAQLIGETALIL